MNNDAVVRVRYFDRQFLRTQDFVDEQAYHLAMRRRHNVAHHRWGIVRGLQISFAEGSFAVAPGMAVDGFGRELIVGESRQISVGAFDERGVDDLDVWLAYDLIETDAAPSGYAGCGQDAATFTYRVLEQPWIRLSASPPDPGAANRRMPQDVPDGDVAFDPIRTPPDDPEQDFPVFLGRIFRQRARPTQPFVYDTDPANRPYAGLVGESIHSPSGLTRVQIGAEHGDDRRRFAVFVPDPPATDAGHDPYFEILDDGAVNVRGQTTLFGDLTMAHGSIELGDGGHRDGARPWQIYHESDDESHHELRVEMGPRGATPGLNQVVIGSWSPDDKKFHPCLTVSDDGTVTVHGNLVVEGGLHELVPRGADQFGPEANAMLLAAHLSGIAGGNVVLQPGPHTALLGRPVLAQLLTPEIDLTQAMSSTIDAMADDAASIQRFAELVKHQDDDAGTLAKRIADALTGNGD